MFRFVRRLRHLAPLCATFSLISGTAAAASPGGVRVVVQEWSPANPTVQNDRLVVDEPGLLSDALATGWAKARGPVCAAIAKYAGKPDLVSHGVTLYEIECRMAATGSLTVTGFANDLLTLTYTLPGNEFKAKATQDTVAGAYANPCMFVDYDVTATTSVHLSTLAVDAFKVSIGNVSRPDSCNTAGDVEKFFANAYHFFGGPDYLARVQSALNVSQSIATGPLKTAVASIVDPLARYSNAYTTRTNWIRNGNVYIVLAPRYAPANFVAGIDGVIAVTKDVRAAAPDCSSFTLTGRVQTGPAPIYDPVALTTTDPPFASVGGGHGSGVASDRGDRFECAYSATQMPAAVPVRYAGSGIAQADGRIARVGLIADGWTGDVALASVVPGKNFKTALLPDATRFTTQYFTNRTIADTHPNYDAVKNGDFKARITPVADLSDLNPQPLPPAHKDADLANGNRLFASGDFAGAAAAYDRSHRANASSAVALHNLALAHARLGQTGRAAGEFRQAAALAHASGDIATEKSAQTAIIIVGGAQR